MNVFPNIGSIINYLLPKVNNVDTRKVDGNTFTTIVLADSGSVTIKQFKSNVHESEVTIIYGNSAITKTIIHDTNLELVISLLSLVQSFYNDLYKNGEENVG